MKIYVVSANGRNIFGDRFFYVEGVYINMEEAQQAHEQQLKCLGVQDSQIEEFEI